MVDPGDPGGLTASFDETERRAEALSGRLLDLRLEADAFSRTMSRALTGAVVGGRQLDDVLKSLVLRLSDMALKAALTPLGNGLAGGLQSLLGGLLGGASGPGAGGMPTVTPFATGGVIGAPTWFPLAAGGLGLAGEAGPEAIVPLARGADGRLGIAGGTGEAAVRVTVNITAQDAASFRASEVYLTGQIARAVARGRRGL
ncbi:phage tail tape measure protein [Rhodoplanes serenus]|uniref:Phage tail tape measure protein n=1 Tax=Rhodoplanes serenus TaxID=200615 RepID=A0A9X4XJ13_9BRAD|nr:phage tail tape measure protein [Rhodoplanes serenus]MTW15174.1 phage tail tape measure protein [Rhodoplanes serenus]